MSDSQGTGGQDSEKEQQHPGTADATAGHTPAEPAAANQDAPSDAPGAATAPPGATGPSPAAAPGQAPPGTDRPATEEVRAEVEGRGETGGSGAPVGATMHGCPVDESSGATVVHCSRERYLDLCRGLKADGYAMPVGVTGVDYLTHPGRLLPDGIRPERFEVVVELLNLAAHKRVRVRCQVPAADPHTASLFQLWPGVEAHERETYDMFGIRFDGHPDMTRILMPDDWEGHPLRKDYDTGHIPIQFKEAPR
ncbi:MAG TPA: NADH-quinone oxidoreductase subunit C [Acidimicrobiales bacterium]|nr:NADH-quinone oxidoreductase subunit C [Acidimicrobiales bacterium]